MVMSISFHMLNHHNMSTCVCVYVCVCRYDCAKCWKRNKTKQYINQKTLISSREKNYYNTISAMNECTACRQLDVHCTRLYVNPLKKKTVDNVFVIVVTIFCTKLKLVIAFIYIHIFFGCFSFLTF